MENIRIIINYFKKFKIKKRYFLMGLAAGATGSTLSALAPIFYGDFVEGLVDKNIDFVLISLFFYILLLVGYKFFYLLNNYFAFKSYKHIFRKIQKRIVEKLPDNVNEDETVMVKTINVINDSLDNVSDLSDQLSDTIVCFMTIIISFVILFNYSVIGFFIVLSITFLSLFIYEKANVQAEEFDINYRVRKDNLTDTIINIFKTKNDKLYFKYNEDSEKMVNAKKHLFYNWVLRIHGIPLLLHIIKGLFILYLVYAYFNNVLGIDDVIVIIAYYETISADSDELVGLFTNLKFANVSMERIDSII